MSARIDAILAKPSPEFIGKIEGLVREAVNLISDGKDGSSVVAEINRLTGRNYVPDVFFEMWGWTGEDEFAQAAAYPPATPVDDLSRDELLEILSYITQAKEPQSTVLIDFLERTFPGVFDTDLIFYPYRDMTDEEIVDELLYRIELVREGGSETLHAYLLQLAEDVSNDPHAKAYSQMWANGVLKNG